MRPTKMTTRNTSPKISHAEFQNMVVQLARLKGWKVQYWWKSIHSPAGFPDAYMVRLPRQVFLEFKVEPDKPSEAQLEWIALLSQLPNTKALVVYYRDWDEIVRLLGE